MRGSIGYLKAVFEHPKDPHHIASLSVMEIVQLMSIYGSGLTDEYFKSKTKHMMSILHCCTTRLLEVILHLPEVYCIEQIQHQQ